MDNVCDEWTLQPVDPTKPFPDLNKANKQGGWVKCKRLSATQLLFDTRKKKEAEARAGRVVRRR
jgi:hypothetical protein